MDIVLLLNQVCNVLGDSYEIGLSVTQLAA